MRLLSLLKRLLFIFPNDVVVLSCIKMSFRQMIFVDTSRSQGHLIQEHILPLSRLIASLPWLIESVSTSWTVILRHIFGLSF